MKQSILYVILILLFTASCKKGKDNPNGNQKKIASAVVNNINNVFSYDEQGRLQRIDYGVNTYLLVEYTPAGIVLQWYDIAGNPVTTRRYAFNILDGRIVSGKESKPNGFVINHSYIYDNEGRLIEQTGREVYEATNEEGNKATFNYTYTGDNASRITYLRIDRGIRRDSIIVTRSYYTNKKLFTWQAVGFGFFGTATSGLPHQGAGIASPAQMLPFLTYYPSVNAIKENTTEIYEWSTSQNKWVYKNTNTYTLSETDYQYDGAGYLTAFAGAIKIEWE